ncbi:hypothetical protein TRVL_07832 [Trypanosoma vivax]|nr:hypothetical protein TRVL_07832 [Trypanosoma vivax]
MAPQCPSPSHSLKPKSQLNMTLCRFLSVISPTCTKGRETNSAAYSSVSARRLRRVHFLVPARVPSATEIICNFVSSLPSSGTTRDSHMFRSASRLLKSPAFLHFVLSPVFRLPLPHSRPPRLSHVSSTKPAPFFPIRSPLRAKQLSVFHRPRAARRSMRCIRPPCAHNVFFPPRRNYNRDGHGRGSRLSRKHNQAVFYPFPCCVAFRLCRHARPRVAALVQSRREPSKPCPCAVSATVSFLPLRHILAPCSACIVPSHAFDTRTAQNCWSQAHLPTPHTNKHRSLSEKRAGGH